MSKVQYQPVTNTDSAVPAGHVRKTYKFFDLEDFTKKAETVDIPFTPVTSIPSLDEETLLKAINSYLKAETLANVEREVSSKGGKTSVVMAIAKPFRAMAPFNQIFKKDASGAVVLDSDGAKVIDRQAQTQAILKMIKSNEEMLNAIKSASLEGDDSGDEGNDE